MNYAIWIISVAWHGDEVSIDRNSLISEGVIGGHYENIRLYDEFKLAGFDTKLINPKNLSIVNDKLILNNNIVKCPDMIILRQSNLDAIKKTNMLISMGAKCINNPQGHMNCADKELQYNILKSSNINIPETKFVNIPFEESDISEISNTISWPVIVKPIWSQRGDNVELCANMDDVYIHAKKIKKTYNNGNKMMVQKYVPGPIIVAWVIGHEIISAQIRESKSEDFFISNHRENTIRSKYNINNKLNNLAVSSTKAVGVEIAKLDIFENSGNYMICEINSPGGYSGRDHYFDSNHARDIVRYVMDIIK